jgi:UDP-N-acetylglucosamine 4,6-dehydratase
MRRILVTGGSGFFGRGFVRRALDMGAERVCVYSRGEYAQHLMREEFGIDNRLRLFIGDVRDPIACAARWKAATWSCTPRP